MESSNLIKTNKVQMAAFKNILTLIRNSATASESSTITPDSYTVENKNENSSESL